MMQTSQKLKTNNQYQENQADLLPKKYENQTRSLPPEALTWYPAGGPL